MGRCDPSNLATSCRPTAFFANGHHEYGCRHVGEIPRGCANTRFKRQAPLTWFVTHFAPCDGVSEFRLTIQKRGQPEISLPSNNVCSASLSTHKRSNNEALNNYRRVCNLRPPIFASSHQRVQIILKRTSTIRVSLMTVLKSWDVHPSFLPSCR